MEGDFQKKAGCGVSSGRFIKTETYPFPRDLLLRGHRYPQGLQLPSGYSRRNRRYQRGREGDGVDAVRPYIAAVSGVKNSGKTTFLEKLIPELKKEDTVRQ